MLSPVRNAVRRLSPGTILGLLALVVAMSGISIAKIPGDGGKISGCYKKKSGKLRVINADKGKHCRRGERALTWSQQGPQGAAGRDGAAGPAGPAGTPDTADFFTKGESDARFLGSGGTAADASKLGGQAPGSYLLDTETAADSAALNGTRADAFAIGAYGGNQLNSFGSQRLAMGRQRLPRNTGFTTILGGLLGSIEASCGNPTSTTIRYVNQAGSGAAQDVFFDDGGPNPTLTNIPFGGSVTATTLNGIPQVERLIIQVGGGQTDAFTTGGRVATFVVTAVNAPGGANECLVQGQVVAQLR
jgi:hypothetical protein